jgi:hypothetical protein
MRAPFPGSKAGAPFGTFALIWALPAEQRREIAWIELGDDATLSARGRQWGAGYALAYELETSRGYVTERLAARVTGGAAVTLERGRSSELEGVADCDLGFSPLTNAMPVLRDRLEGNGKAFEIDVAWVSVPDLSVQRDHQIYEPLGSDRIRFCSPAADFERRITLTEDGFVRDYPDIAHLLATIVRIPLHGVADWDSFYAVVGSALELPPPGGPRLDGWIDSLAQSEHAKGPARYAVPPGTALTLQLDGLTAFAERCPAQHAALMRAIAEVNRRRCEQGDPALLGLSASG